MTDPGNVRHGATHGIVEVDGVDSVEAYESGELTVLYDAHDPLAWIESSTAIRIDNAR